jgi:uncharacterized membrane protein YfcA
MTSKPKLTGLGIALGAALGAAFGVAAGHMAVWLAVGVAIGMLLGATLHRKLAQCPLCEEMHSTHTARERTSAK